MSEPEGESCEKNHWDTKVSAVSTGFAWQPRFWKEEFQALKPVYRTFAVPASALALGNILAVVTNGTLMEGLSGVTISSDSPGADLTKMLWLSFSLFAATVASLVVSFWALWQFMVRLGGLSKILLQGESASIEALQQSIAAMNERKSYLTVAWTIGSLYLLLPALPEAVLVALMIASRMTMFGQPCLVLPDWAPAAIIPCVICLSVWTVTYAFVLLAVTGIPPEKPHQAANLALGIFFRHFLAMNSLGCAVGIANVLITSPQMFVSGTTAGDFISRNVIVGVLLQVWFGFSSTVLWPLSMAVFCRALRPMVKT